MIDIICGIIIIATNGMLVFVTLLGFFKKSSKIKSTICALLFALCSMYHEVNQCSQSVHIEKEKDNIGVIYDNFKDFTIDSLDENLYNDTEVVSDDFKEYTSNNLGEDFYNDVEISKKERTRIHVIIITVSVISIILNFVLLLKFYSKHKLNSSLLSIITVIIYTITSYFFIIPLEIPESTSVTIPIYENVIKTHLSTNKDGELCYKSETTPILIAKTTKTYYSGKCLIRPYKYIVCLTDICILFPLFIKKLKKLIDYIEKKYLTVRWVI